MNAPLRFLDGGGEAARMIRERSWEGHPLGAPQSWSTALKGALSLVLNSPESMILSWFGPDGVLYFFFNDTYFPLLGPRLPWAMGARFDVVWADALAQAHPIIDAALAGQTQRFVDLPWKLDTDRGVSDTFWSFSYSRVLDEHGEPAGVFIFTNETTARVLSDAALKESQADLATSVEDLRRLNETLEARVDERTAERDRLWEASPDLLTVMSIEGIYRRVNPAWTTILGLAPEDILGRFATSFAHPDDLPASNAAFEEATAAPLRTFDNRFRHKDGSYRWISWVAAPSETEVFAIGRDITAAKEAEAALAAAEEQLRQAQKMEAVGQLTGGLAHDFNNLLAGISGSLEMIGVRITQGRIADVDRYVTAAQGAARRAAAVTHRLLAFSRRQTLTPEAVDINRLMADLVDLVRRTVGPAIAVETVGAGGLWTTLVDPNQLENALLNLCINARDAMPDGGRITIETGNKWLDERVAQERGLSPGQYVTVCVSDTGAGMDKAVIERAFDPFFTTKPIGVGTGLGLSMVYGFAKQSGGHVRIYSEPGEGALVCLYLPRHRGEATLEVERTEGPHDWRSAHGGTVLVIDDEPTVRMLVADVLTDLGYGCIEAGDGAAGLRVLESDTTVDLLITDVGLPGGLNGRQVADAARALRPALKVLFVTGYAENAVLSHGHLDPGMQVLTKPFGMDALAERARRMIEESA